MILNCVDSCHVYTCLHCGNRIRLLGEKLLWLQSYPLDSTIGVGQLAALCMRCSHVGMAPVDPVAQTVTGKEWELLDCLHVEPRKMRCAMETCKSPLWVVAVLKAGTTYIDVTAAFSTATIPDGFSCSEGHQIVSVA